MLNINIGTTEVKVTNARDSTSKLWERANKLHNIKKTAPKVILRCSLFSMAICKVF